MTSLPLRFSLAKKYLSHMLLVRSPFSKFWVQPLVIHPLLLFFPCSFQISSLAQLFLCISHIFFSYALLGPFSLSLSHSPFFPSPPLCEGIYSTILLRSMWIIPFSTMNILIHGGISSNDFFLGPITNLLSASLYSMENSMMHPSLTQLNQRLIA
jgi:hypothetical protein